MSDSDNPMILRIAVPSPLWQALDYLPPAEVVADWQPGQRFLVPLGRREVMGVLVAVVDKPEVAAHQLKAALAQVDVTPVWTEPMWQLCCWAASYYHYPLGAALAEILPAGLRQGRATLPPNPLSYEITDLGRSVLLARTHRGVKQRAALMAAADGLTVDASREQGLQAAVKRLLEKEWLVKVERPVEPWRHTAQAPVVQLNDEQEQAVAAIVAARGFSSFLLAGVTGSGKTEVYLAAMQAVLAAGRQVLYLVPEIALTPQTLARLRAALAVPVVAYHSGLADGERLLAWQRASAGQAAVVVGTRSAVFLPLAKPGMIVVDEEHDVSFKQQSTFRYHARDLAVRRAQLEDVPIVLGSATPSLHSYRNAKLGRYQLLSLQRPAIARQLAKKTLQTLKPSHYQVGIGPALRESIDVHLQQQKQVMLFLNRRGFAPLYLCPQCQHMASCKHCDANLTYHNHAKQLICHHCNYRERAQVVCSSCKRAEMIAYGLGTEQLEEQARELFPQHRVLRIDRDTSGKRGVLEQQLQAVTNREADILIGTQMLAKGHHFPHLTCVVVVNADQGFLSSDFRATEQTAALLEQVSGRAGREEAAGEVILQTLQPHNAQLELLLESGYMALADQLLVDREQAGLPPIAAMALIGAEARQASSALQLLSTLKRALGGATWEWMGPMPALLSKRANWYRVQLCLLAPTRAQLQQQLQQVVAWLRQQGSRQVRWFVDVDPTSLM